MKKIETCQPLTRARPVLKSRVLSSPRRIFNPDFLMTERRRLTLSARASLRPRIRISPHTQINHLIWALNPCLPISAYLGAPRGVISSRAPLSHRSSNRSQRSFIFCINFQWLISNYLPNFQTFFIFDILKWQWG